MLEHVSAAAEHSSVWTVMNATPPGAVVTFLCDAIAGYKCHYLLSYLNVLRRSFSQSNTFCTSVGSLWADYRYSITRERKRSRPSVHVTLYQNVKTAERVVKLFHLRKHRQTETSLLKHQTAVKFRMLILQWSVKCKHGITNVSCLL